MTAKEILISSLNLSKTTVNMFLSDLDDADIQVHPAGANNIAWQMAHLITAEVRQGEQAGISYPPLPPVFEPFLKMDAAGMQSHGGNLSKTQYLKLFNEVRDKTIAGVAALDEATLDKPTGGPISHLAPRLGDLLALTSTHTMMHAGQFTTVRRLLKKPVLF